MERVYHLFTPGESQLMGLVVEEESLTKSSRGPVGIHTQRQSLQSVPIRESDLTISYDLQR